MSSKKMQESSSSSQSGSIKVQGNHTWEVSSVHDLIKTIQSKKQTAMEKTDFRMGKSDKFVVKIGDRDYEFYLTMEVKDYTDPKKIPEVGLYLYNTNRNVSFRANINFNIINKENAKEHGGRVNNYFFTGNGETRIWAKKNYISKLPQDVIKRAKLKIHCGLSVFANETSEKKVAKKNVEAKGEMKVEKKASKLMDKKVAEVKVEEMVAKKAAKKSVEDAKVEKLVAKKMDEIKAAKKMEKKVAKKTKDLEGKEEDTQGEKKEKKKTSKQSSGDKAEKKAAKRTGEKDSEANDDKKKGKRVKKIVSTTVTTVYEN